MNDVERYPLRVFWSDEDQGFIATAPDLPGCSAFAKDEASAIVEVRQAISAWVDAARAAGNAIPQPSSVTHEDQYSGKFVLRMPRRLHRLAAERAEADGVSLNQFLVTLIAFDLGEQQGIQAGKYAPAAMGDLRKYLSIMEVKTTGDLQATLKAGLQRIQENFLVRRTSSERVDYSTSLLELLRAPRTQVGHLDG